MIRFDSHVARATFFVLLIAASALPGLMRAASVDALLQAFDTHNTVPAANAFFQQLDREQFTETPIHFAAGTHADTLRQQVWYWAAEWLYDQQQYDRAASYGLRALPYCKTGGNRTVEADCENLLAVIYIRLADYTRAAQHAQVVYALDRRSGDPDAMSSSLNTLAAIYMGARQPEEAEKFILRALETARRADNPARQAVINGMASEIYHTLGDEQKALDYATTAYELETKLGRADKAAMRQAQRGAALLWLKRTDEAQQALEQAIPQLRADGNRQSLGIACNQMGGVMLAKHRLAEAEKYYREAADIFTELHDFYNESHTRLGLYNVLKDSDPKAALAEMERYKALKDSIYSSQAAESLGRFSAEYANEELLLENANERASKRTVVVVGVLIVMALALIGLLIGRNIWRRNRKQAAINDELSAHINELREKYEELHTHYDKAMATTAAGLNDEELTDDDQRFIELTVNVVNERINAGQIDAASVAEQLNMSPYQFRQRLSAITGETPQSFIQIMRLRRARHLLDGHPELSISEVAQLCAYTDTPNFTRAFRNAFGITPSQYQSNHK